MRWYLLHPMAAHFPIALLLVGLGAAAASLHRRAADWLPAAASWLLWGGTAAAWLAAGLGLLAEKTAPHVPPAWEALADHKELGLWTAGLFAVLSVWRIFWPGRWRVPLLLAWLVAAGFLAATAKEGGAVVYDFGMGVGSQR